MTPRSSDMHHPGEAHLQDIGQRLNWLRAGVLGANDGIVSVAGLVVDSLVADGPVTEASLVEVGPAAVAGDGNYLIITFQNLYCLTK